MKMDWEYIGRKVSRTKLWGMIGGGGVGLAVVDHGLGMDSGSLVQSVTILGGLILIGVSVASYIYAEGKIDEARERATALKALLSTEEDDTNPPKSKGM